MAAPQLFELIRWYDLAQNDVALLHELVSIHFHRFVFSFFVWNLSRYSEYTLNVRICPGRFCLRLMVEVVFHQLVGALPHDAVMPQPASFADDAGDSC